MLKCYLFVANSTLLGILPKGQLILIADTIRADGSFLLHHFIHMFLKGNSASCVVGLEQSLFHYFNVARKLVSSAFVLGVVTHKYKGVNLTAEHTKGNFAFINALSTPYIWTTQHEGMFDTKLT